jgi:hypothetical protein
MTELVAYENMTTDNRTETFTRTGTCFRRFMSLARNDPQSVNLERGSRAKVAISGKMNRNRQRVGITP